MYRFNISTTLRAWDCDYYLSSVDKRYCTSEIRWRPAYDSHVYYIDPQFVLKKKLQQQLLVLLVTFYCEMTWKRISLQKHQSPAGRARFSSSPLPRRPKRTRGRTRSRTPICPTMKWSRRRRWWPPERGLTARLKVNLTTSIAYRYMLYPLLGSHILIKKNLKQRCNAFPKRLIGSISSRPKRVFAAAA